MLHKQSAVNNPSGHLGKINELFGIKIRRKTIRGSFYDIKHATWSISLFLLYLFSFFLSPQRQTFYCLLSLNSINTFFFFKKKSEKVSKSIPTKDRKKKKPLETVTLCLFAFLRIQLGYFMLTNLKNQL